MKVKMVVYANCLMTNNLDLVSNQVSCNCAHAKGKKKIQSKYDNYCYSTVRLVPTFIFAKLKISLLLIPLINNPLHFSLCLVVWVFFGLGDQKCEHSSPERQQVHRYECV